MIIQAEGPRALLITQPDHAALAGRIMTRWTHSNFATHPRRASILLAISEHDNGWREVDVAPVLDESCGRMLDFVNVPADVRRAIWPRGVERLAREGQDPWAAALVAQHAVHVYRHYREDRDWNAFFGELEQTRDRYVDKARLRTAEASLDALLADYFFVRMGDLLSLTFCNAWTKAPEEIGYEITCDRKCLIVTPDPFERQDWEIDVPARELPNEAFQTPADAERAFRAAAGKSYRGTVRGAPDPGGAR